MHGVRLLCSIRRKWLSEFCWACCYDTRSLLSPDHSKGEQTKSDKISAQASYQCMVWCFYFEQFWWIMQICDLFQKTADCNKLHSFPLNAFVQSRLLSHESFSGEKHRARGSCIWRLFCATNAGFVYDQDRAHKVM